MNPSLSPVQDVGDKMDVGIMLALPGYSPKQAVLPVSSPRPAVSLLLRTNDLIETVAADLNELVEQVISKTTAEEFLAATAKVFPRYFEAAWGLSLLMAALVPDEVLEVIRSTSLSNLEDSFREQGLEAFGADVRDQAVFTAWTLRKISDTCQRIDAAPLLSQMREKDRHLYQQFASHSMVTRFYLDCLSRSMILHRPLHPAVLPIIVDGLRNAVNAYAYARRALDLRVPPPDIPIGPVEWDDEDEELLAEAKRDMLPGPA